MKKTSKLLLFMFSFLMTFGIFLNVNNYVYAEDINDNVVQDEDSKYLS